jgi:ABC-type nitrate/sulfonate/bicarbonate transport system substrate-binding protein
MQRSIKFLGSLLAAALFTMGPASPQEKKQIRIATSSSSIPAGPARMAKELGLFEKHGLEATVTPMDTGITATSGLLSGSVDFVSTGPSDVVLSHGNGQNVVVVANGYRGFAANIVISKAAQERSGVAPNAPVAERLKVLGDLRIATTSAASTFAVGPRSAIEGVGGKVNFTYMAQPAMVAAFQRGLIDAFVVASPYYVTPIRNGSGLMWISGPRGDFPQASAPANSSVIIARREFADANPELMKRIAAVFADFSKAIDERPAEVKAAMRKLWPDLDQETVDFVFEVERGGFRASPVTVEDMARDIAFMKLGGVALPQADRLDPAKMVLPSR